MPDPRLSGGLAASQGRGQQPQLMQPAPNQWGAPQQLPPIGRGGTMNPAQMMGGGQQLLNPAAQEDKTCKVCMDKKINTVMVPCGHQVLCENCSKVINKQCPICNQPVQQVIKTFS